MSTHKYYEPDADDLIVADIIFKTGSYETRALHARKVQGEFQGTSIYINAQNKVDKMDKSLSKKNVYKLGYVRKNNEARFLDLAENTPIPEIQASGVTTYKRRPLGEEGMSTEAYNQYAAWINAVLDAAHECGLFIELS
jgi:hypothetical protein